MEFADVEVKSSGLPRCMQVEKDTMHAIMPPSARMALSALGIARETHLELRCIREPVLRKR